MEAVCMGKKVTVQKTVIVLQTYQLVGISVVERGHIIEHCKPLVVKV